MGIISVSGGQNGRQKGGATFGATWRAISSLPLNQFPLLLPQAHPVAAPFILWRLKRLGFSNCRVVSKKGGLLVFADR